MEDCNNESGQEKWTIIPMRRATAIIGMSAFVCVYVNDLETELLIDSGAAVTVISVEFWEKIPKIQRPELCIADDTVKLEAANGELIMVKGKANFLFTFDNLELEWEAFVADIGDNGIIGYDFLYHHDCELAARRGLTIAGQSVKCHLKGIPEEENKVALLADVTIPAYSEAIVSCSSDISTIESNFAVVEPILLTDDDHINLVLGHSLIDTRRSDIAIPVRVMNTADVEVKLRTGMKLGFLHEVEDIEEIDDRENTDIDQLCRTYSICKVHSVSRSEEHTGDNATEGWCEDLKTLYSKSVEEVEASDAKKVKALLNRHQSVFAKSPDDHGRTNIVQHTIDTGDAKPVRQPPRRPPKAFEADEDEIIEQQLRAGIITESTSPWASPLVFVRKRDGTTRICVDYRRVNDLTSFCAYPLPRIADCLDCMHGAKIFSTLDLQAGYWQIEVKPEDRPKIAFICRRGLFEYVTMPFGLCNAPSTFERCMELIMRGLQWKTLLIYLDDLIIFSSTFDDHIARLDEVFSRLGKAGLKLKPSKCALFQEKVIFLGHLITSEGVGPDPQKVEAVRDWPTPKNITGVRSFLGLCSYYRRFICGFAHIAGPLHSLLEAGQAFVWSDECQQAFETLKSKLIGADVMSYPNDDGLFILDTDASDTGIGATLSQMQKSEQNEDKEEERPIAYASQSMTKAQRRYCTTRRELLAIVTFTHKFRHYLLGRRFLIRTDHSALRWVMSFKEPVDQMARWLELLSQYSFRLEHRAGKKHTNADALSRRDCDPDQCDCYNRDSIISELPCGGCDYCVKRHQMWSDFFEVDDVVPLSTKTIGVKQNILQDDTTTTQTKLKNASQKENLCYDTNSPPNVTIFLACFITLMTLTLVITRSIGRHVYNLVKFVIECVSRGWSGANYLHGGVMKFTISKVNQASGKLPGNKAAAVNVNRNNHSWIDGYTAEEIKKLQRDDSDLFKIIGWLEESTSRPDKDHINLRHESPAVRNMYLLWKQLLIKDGVLYKKWETTDHTRSYLQVVVPKTLRHTVMYAMHNSITSGHLGFKKTYEKVKRRFYWYNQKEDISNWIKKCVKCGARKRPLHKPQAPLSDIRVGAPMDRLDTDILGPLPISDNGMKYILLVQDQFTKWIECFALPDQTAATVAHKIVFEYISRFGTPLTIHSDQGTNYESQLFQQICSLLEVNKVHCTPFHPQANGSVEAFNKTLLDMISMYVNKHQRDWDKYLPLLTSAYRSCEHASTGYSPNMMFLGRETYQPVEVLFGEPYLGYAQDVKGEICDYVIELRERMTTIYDLVRDHQQKMYQSKRKDCDTTSSFHHYKVGDLVFVRDSTRSKGLSPKLQPNWRGPGIIIRKLSDLVFDIRLNQKGTSKILHHDRLKPYASDEVPRWVSNLQGKLGQDKCTKPDTRRSDKLSSDAMDRATQVDLDLRNMTDKTVVGVSDSQTTPNQLKGHMKSQIPRQRHKIKTKRTKLPLERNSEH